MMRDELRRRQGGRDHAVNGARHHVGIPAGFKSEWMAGIAAIRTLASTMMVIWLLMRL